MENEVKTNLIKFIRANTPSKSVTICDTDGSNLRTITVPMWRSDECKLTYPEFFFKQSDIDETVEMIKGYIADKDLDLKVEVQDDYYIEVASCYGWKVRIVEA